MKSVLDLFCWHCAEQEWKPNFWDEAEGLIRDFLQVVHKISTGHGLTK
jgi:hypothetical protein